MAKYRIARMPGDGIGNEPQEGTKRVLDASVQLPTVSVRRFMELLAHRA